MKKSLYSPGLSLCNRFGLQSNEFSDALEAFSIKCQSGFGKGDFNKFVSELQAHVNKVVNISQNRFTPYPFPFSFRVEKTT